VDLSADGKRPSASKLDIRSKMNFACLHAVVPVLQSFAGIVNDFQSCFVLHMTLFPIDSLSLLSNDQPAPTAAANKKNNNHFYL